MSLTAFDLLTDPNIKDRAWDEHHDWDRVNGVS